MLLISHRGNLDGPIPHLENSPEYLLSAQSNGYGVEVDIWYSPCMKSWFLGHDTPTYSIEATFFEKLDPYTTFWHAKNVEAFELLIRNYSYLNYFWHENDNYTLTSHAHPWVYPNKRLFTGSICVKPELGYDGNLHSCMGICSDYISTWKDTFPF